jgi:hypothetical protein
MAADWTWVDCRSGTNALLLSLRDCSLNRLRTCGAIDPQVRDVDRTAVRPR